MPNNYNCPIQFIYEKGIVLVPKSEKIVAKINEVTSWYKTDTPTAKSNMSQKGKSELKKGVD